MKGKCNKYPNESMSCIRKIYLFIGNKMSIDEWLIIEFGRLQTAMRTRELGQPDELKMW